VVGPPAAGAFRERPPKSRTFRMFYERGDFPMALHRNAKGSQWKCPARPETGMSLRERGGLLFIEMLHAMSVLSAASERTEREREAEGSFIELVGVSYSEHSFIVYHGITITSRGLERVQWLRGATREFCTLLMRQIPAYSICEGPEERRTLALDTLQKGHYKIIGQMTVGVPATGVGVAAFLVRPIAPPGMRLTTDPCSFGSSVRHGTRGQNAKGKGNHGGGGQRGVGEASEELSLMGGMRFISNLSQREELLAAVLHHHCDGLFIEDTTPPEAEDIHRAFGVSSLSVEGSNRRRVEARTTGSWRDWLQTVEEDGHAQFPTANTCAFVLRLPVFGMGVHLHRFIPGTQASAKHLQAFLIDGLGRWNEDRAAAASGEVEPLHSDSGHLKHALNQKSQRVLGRQLVKDFTKPAEYTGELIGVEFLYRQTGKVLEDVSLDPDIPDKAAAIQSLEEVDEGIEEDVEDPTVFQPDIPSTSTAARSGDPADAPRSEPSGPAAPHQPDPPEAPAQQSSSEEMQGLDGQPGYQHVLKLANALLEARSLQRLSDKRVDELMALWQRLPEPDRRRVVYPPRHRERQPKGRFKTAKGKNTSCPGKESLQRASRLVEAICSQLCRLHPTATRFGGIMRTRWFLILTDYVAMREADPVPVVLSAPERQGVSVLLQGTGVVPAAAVAVQPLPPAKGLSFVQVGQGQPFHYNISEVPGSSGPPPLRVPTAYRKRKAAEADAARGGPSPWSKARQQTGQYTCSKCGQAERIDTGHTRFAGVSYCAAAGGKACPSDTRFPENNLELLPSTHIQSVTMKTAD
ncbi:hypothetical protein KUCAC02_034461, partial [Chaenocephalus aceratus]